ncbi:uncharacterized protein [Periplaneta americana]|uniref:uncharacterized protein n=1 Tax=Periplaneta americana TaxID=6978 RepID=UPI0037E90462
MAYKVLYILGVFTICLIHQNGYFISGAPTKYNTKAMERLISSINEHLPGLEDAENDKKELTSAMKSLLTNLKDLRQLRKDGKDSKEIADKALNEIQILQEKGPVYRRKEEVNVLHTMLDAVYMIIAKHEIEQGSQS